MSWKWVQSSGELWHGDLEPVATGYSGSPEGKNDPSKQSVHNVGPIPQGLWTIVGPPQNTESHGPFVLHLYPNQGTETFGRDGFLIHGDSVSKPGTASEGCVILARNVRERIWNSGDRDFEVVES